MLVKISKKWQISSMLACIQKCLSILFYFSFFCNFSLFAHLSFSLHPFIFSTPFFPFHYFLHKHYIQTWKWEKTQKTYTFSGAKTQRLHWNFEKWEKKQNKTMKEKKKDTKRKEEQWERKEKLQKKGTSENKRRKRIKWKNRKEKTLSYKCGLQLLKT